MNKTISSQYSNLYLLTNPNTSPQYLLTSTLTIKQSPYNKNRKQLLIGPVTLDLLPQTLIEFESPQKNRDHTLTYYFSSTGSNYMVKVRQNPELIHMAIRNSGCRRKQVQPRSNNLQQNQNQNLNQNQQQGWIDKLKGMIGLQQPQRNINQPNPQYLMLNEPSNRFQPMDCPNNSPQQQQNAQTQRINSILQAVGSAVTHPSFQYFLSQSPNDSPMMSAGKYFLSGAIDTYRRNQTNGINQNR